MGIPLETVIVESLHMSPNIEGEWRLINEMVKKTPHLKERFFLRVYQRERSGGLSFEHRIEANFPGASPEAVQNAFCDLDLRRVWDKEMVDGHYDATSQTACYIQRYPFPFRPRQFNYHQFTALQKIHGTPCLVIAQLADTSQYKICSNTAYVTVSDFHQLLILQPSGTGGCRLVFSCFEEPTGLVPGFMINQRIGQRLYNQFNQLYVASLKSSAFASG